MFVNTDSASGNAIFVAIITSGKSDKVITRGGEFGFGKLINIICGLNDFSIVDFITINDSIGDNLEKLMIIDIFEKV